MSTIQSRQNRDELLKEIDLLRRQVGDLKAEVFSLQQKQPSSKKGNRSSIVREQAAVALQEEIKFRETFVQNLPLFFVVVDSKGKLLLISDLILQALGYNRDEVVGKDYLTTFVPEPEREKVSRIFQELTHKNEPTINESHFIAKNGNELLMEWHGRSILHENGKLDCFYGVGTNITDRKRAEEVLREHESKYRRLYNSMMEAFVNTDMSGRIQETNCAFQTLLGYSEEELKQLYYTDLTPEKWHAFESEIVKNQIIPHGYSDVYEKEYRKKDGTTIPVELRTFLLRDAFGQPIGMWAIICDITERKSAEKKLEEWRQLMDFIIRHDPNAIAVYDENLRYVFVSERYLDDYKLKERNIIGKHHYEVFPEMPERWKQVHQRVLAGAVERSEEDRFERLDGSVDYNRWECRPWYRLDGSVGGMITYTEVITERKRAEEALRKSEEKFRQIVENANEGIWAIDGQQRVAFVNQRMASMIGYSPEEMIGQSADSFIFDEDFQDHNEKMKRRQRGESAAYERRLLCKDGKGVWTIVSASPIMNPEGQFVGAFGMFTDITERKQVEKNLKETEKKYRELAESLPQVIFEVDSNGNLIYLNLTGHELFGYTPEDFAKGFNVLEAFIPEDRERIALDIMLNIQGQRLGRQDYTALRKDGTRFPAGVHADRVMSGQTATGIRGILIDLTETQKAEEEKKKLETQLRQAQKMEAIGSLAGGIAHDFNNILSVIIGNTELLEMSDVSSDAKDGLHQIFTASQRAKQLVRQILAFSRQGEQQKRLISLKPMVQETVDFLRASIPATIQLKHYIKPDAGAVMADSTQVQQVLMNLSTNAAHAMEEKGGVLKIELGNITIAEEDARSDPEAEPGEYVRLTVSDTGHGIEPGVLHRIFDPYFTTKGPEKGTGLGLAVVHGIVKSHGGIIKVYSEVGKGTVFHVLLPRAAEEVKREEKIVRLLPPGTERILVVDDEKPLTDIYQHMLGMLGYQVETRTSPIEAVEAVRGNPQKYDLVITDMTMPNMTGYNLAKKLMEIRPGLPVILCTGFSDQVNEEKARSAGILAFLFKPVPLHDLANTLRKILDEAEKKKSS